MWKITKTQEEKEHERLDKEMIAFYKIMPLDQKKRANLALIHGRIEALEQTTIIPKQTKIVESDKVTETTTEKIQEATKQKVETFSDTFCKMTAKKVFVQHKLKKFVDIKQFGKEA